ncbi:YbaN family protein [Streptococcus iniae]|nr:hypothetical protein BKX95_03500 [Streptococcus iniae]
MKKIIYLTLGLVSFILGIIGILLPVLPTTPFLLLAAFCFSRSSDRFTNWLKNSRLYELYVGDYPETRVMSRKRKRHILIQVYVLMAISITLSPIIMLKIVLFVMTCVMTAVLILFVPEQ